MTDISRSHRRDDDLPEAGSSGADQHITGPAETGTFLEDEQQGDVPVHGSSNAGVNETRANRSEADGSRQD